MFSANKKPKQESKKSASLAVTIGASAGTNFFMHPFRVTLNEAGLHKNAYDIFYNAKGKMLHEVKYNMGRGFVALFMQLNADKFVNTYYGHDNYMKNTLGVMAITLAGGAATPLEVWFMRKSALREHGQFFVKPPCSFKYNFPILGYFVAREFWFSLSVFKAKDLQDYQKIPVFLSAALMTAMFHKMVSIEVTKDIRRIEGQVPDYSIGLKAVFRNLAYGGVYTYGSLATPIAKPKTSLQLGYNLFSATCGWNMLAVRGSYLVACAAVLNFLKAEFNQAEEKWKAHNMESQPEIEKRAGMRKE